MKEIDFIDLQTSKTPKEILEEDFPSIGLLPIKGGWGYDQNTACIIDKNNPCVDPDRPFNGVALEYLFAKYRVYEELIVRGPKDHDYADIQLRLNQQETFEHEGRKYDVLDFKVTALCEVAANSQLFRSASLRKYWFDITSFYGKR